MSDVSQLDSVLSQLEKAVGEAVPPDALDRILAEPPRTTAVTSLGEAPAMQAFRSELAAGMVRAETALRVLELVSRLVAYFVRSGA
jgi:hypothetical protein